MDGLSISKNRTLEFDSAFEKFKRFRFSIYMKKYDSHCNRCGFCTFRFCFRKFQAISIYKKKNVYKYVVRYYKWTAFRFRTVQKIHRIDCNVNRIEVNKSCSKQMCTNMYFESCFQESYQHSDLNFF
jgi:hypothetical protein